MDKTSLKKGTRIYYGGDQANDDGLGIILRQMTDNFGTTVDIKMDDGRTFPKIPVMAFSDEYLGHGGTRFVTEEAYTDFRQAQIDKVETTLAKNDAERSTAMSKKRIKITFLWASGKTGYITIPRAMQGTVVQALAKDSRIFHIRLDGMKYNEYVHMFGGLVLDLSDSF